MTETTATTPIQAKAVEIGLCYARREQAQKEWLERCHRGDATGQLVEWQQAEQAEARASDLEDSLASEQPTTLVDALILAGWARVLARGIEAGIISDEEPDLARDAACLKRVLQNLERYLEADAGTSLDAFGLKRWVPVRPRETADARGEPGQAEAPPGLAG